MLSFFLLSRFHFGSLAKASLSIPNLGTEHLQAAEAAGHLARMVSRSALRSSERRSHPLSAPQCLEHIISQVAFPLRCHDVLFLSRWLASIGSFFYATKALGDATSCLLPWLGLPETGVLQLLQASAKEQLTSKPFKKNHELNRTCLQHSGCAHG